MLITSNSTEQKHVYHWRMHWLLLKLLSEGLVNFIGARLGHVHSPAQPRSEHPDMQRQHRQAIIRAATKKSVSCHKLSRRPWPTIHFARSCGNGPELADGIPRLRMALPSSGRLPLRRTHLEVPSSDKLSFFLLTNFSKFCPQSQAYCPIDHGSSSRPTTDGKCCNHTSSGSTACTFRRCIAYLSGQYWR